MCVFASEMTLHMQTCQTTGRLTQIIGQDCTNSFLRNEFFTFVSLCNERL